MVVLKAELVKFRLEDLSIIMKAFLVGGHNVVKFIMNSGSELSQMEELSQNLKNQGRDTNKDIDGKNIFLCSTKNKNQYEGKANVMFLRQ